MNEKGDDFKWMNVWKVYEKKEVGLGAGEKDKLILNGEVDFSFQTGVIKRTVLLDGEKNIGGTSRELKALSIKPGS